MVNKQYNIQNTKKPKNRLTPPNKTVISNVPNPSNGGLTTASSLDSISENNFRQNVKNASAAFGRSNISYLHNNTTVTDDYGVSDDSVSDCDRLPSAQHKNDTSIHDIGRFQYILQMDREMVGGINECIFIKLFHSNQHFLEKIIEKIQF